MNSIRVGAALLLALACAQPASAAWHRASSKHFVIYADQDPERLREFATKLERFDQAVRHVRGMKDYEFGDGNRVQVLVVANDKGSAGWRTTRAAPSAAFACRAPRACA